MKGGRNAPACHKRTLRSLRPPLLTELVAARRDLQRHKRASAVDPSQVRVEMAETGDNLGFVLVDHALSKKRKVCTATAETNRCNRTAAIVHICKTNCRSEMFPQDLLECESLLDRLRGRRMQTTIEPFSGLSAPALRRHILFLDEAIDRCTADRILMALN